MRYSIKYFFLSQFRHLCSGRSTRLECRCQIWVPSWRMTSYAFKVSLAVPGIISGSVKWSLNLMTYKTSRISQITYFKLFSILNKTTKLLFSNSCINIYIYYNCISISHFPMLCKFLLNLSKYSQKIKYFVFHNIFFFLWEKVCIHKEHILKC